MSEKKIINQEELDKVSGGFRRDLDILQYDLTAPEGGAIYNAPADGRRPEYPKNHGLIEPRTDDLE